MAYTLGFFLLWFVCSVLLGHGFGLVMGGINNYEKVKSNLSPSSQIKMLGTWVRAMT